MFHLDPGEEYTLLVETTRSFAAESLTPAMRAAESERGVAGEVHEAFAQIGLAGLELPEALGGVELGTVARALVNEELGAADPGAALALDPLGPALPALAELGGAEAIERFAEPLLADRARDPGARAALVDLRDATLEVADGRVHGLAAWVPADHVSFVVVLGDEDALVVEQAFRLEPLRGAGLRAAGASEIHFENAPIAAQWTDPKAASRARARARIYVASLLIGVLRAACDFSRAYALERQAFGRPIAHHQALAFMITDMQMALDGARLLVHDAAWRLDAGAPAAGEAAGAFAETLEAAKSIGPGGVQILGGHGFMADYPVEKYMREARTLSSWLGGLDAAREDGGQALLASPGPIPLSHGER